MPLDPRRVKALFNSALDLSEPADRSSFLDRECGEDRELRQRLDELIAAFDEPAKALEMYWPQRVWARTTAPYQTTVDGTSYYFSGT